MSDLAGYPFESQFKGFDQHENPIFDRALSSALFRAFWEAYYTNGVFFDPADNFQATATGDLNVSVKYGTAHIEGLTILPDAASAITLAMQPALTTGDRYDLIVLRADFTINRSAEIVVKTGASMPEDLQRDASVWELGLAKVLVRQSSTTINQADITDLRLDNAFCGIVTEPIRRVNTEQFFIQMQDQLRLNQEEWNAVFARLEQALTDNELTWDEFFERIQNETEGKLAANQQQWDAFYASIQDDLSVLLQSIGIGPDWIRFADGKTLTEKAGVWDGLPQQIADISGAVGGLQAEATAKWVLLNTVDNRSRTNATDISALNTGLASKATTATYTATIPATGWSGSAAPYSIPTITVTGMLATDTPIVDIVQTGTEATDSVMRENWGKITRIVTKADGITVYASEIPSAAITIQLKVVR